MKFDLPIKGSAGVYNIKIGSGLVTQLDEHKVIICDEAIAKYLPRKTSKVVSVTASEDIKTLAGCDAVIGQLNRLGVRRGDDIIAVGGGVVQDIATLTASLYMRGINWIYFPTTLMSMADSCIGGKSSINSNGVKNLVGNFHPPKEINIDPIFIESLPPEAITSGLAEAVKICFARGLESFDLYLRNPASKHPDNSAETSLFLLHVLESKKWFVEIDEFDKKERQLLNFGHSFGHAWESACHFSVQHGIAVAVGMLAALNHPLSTHNSTTTRLMEYCKEILSSVKPSVSSAFEQTNWALFKESLRTDKKNTSQHLRLILPQQNAELSFVDISLTDAELEIASNSIQTALRELVTS